MAKYVDKQAILNIIASFRTPYRKEVRVEDVYDAVSKVEAVEIIHCKECEHYFDARSIVGCSVGKCEELGLLYTNGEWYCGNAKRREDL